MNYFLHEEVGYVFVDSEPLKKYETNGVIFHDVVKLLESNVKYGSTRLVLTKSDFYKKNDWLLVSYLISSQFYFSCVIKNARFQTFTAYRPIPVLNAYLTRVRNPSGLSRNLIDIDMRLPKLLADIAMRNRGIHNRSLRAIRLKPDKKSLGGSTKVSKSFLMIIETILVSKFLEAKSTSLDSGL